MKYRKGNPNSLDKKKVKGKIIVCVGSTEEEYGTDLKIATLQESGVIGFVYISDQEGADADNYGDFPKTIATTNMLPQSIIDAPFTPPLLMLPTGWKSTWFQINFNLQKIAKH